MQRFTRHLSRLPPGTEWEDNATRRSRFPRYRTGGFSASDDDDFEIVARHHHRAVARPIELPDQRDDVALERRLGAGLQGGEGLQYGPVVGSEDIEEVLGRAVAEDEGARLDADRRGLPLEQLFEARLGAPQRRRLHASRRREVPAQRLEQLADEAVP